MTTKTTPEPNPWQTLCQELVARSPWSETGFCYYCGVPAPGLHTPDCPYWRARLLDLRLQISESLSTLRESLKENLR